MTAQYPTLFSPVRLGPITIKNRIFSSGHATRLNDGAHIGDRLIAYHEARASGGAGLVITEVAMVDERVVYSHASPKITSDAAIQGYRRLAERLHAYDCKVFGQLYHPGREVGAAPDGTLNVAYAPSSAVNERFHVIPRVMSTAMVREVIELYAGGAERMKRAGLDGVEVVASHGYLPAQFLSPGVNDRSDAYGGSFENRLRFVRELASAIRERIGTGMALGLRLSVDELTDDGLTPETAIEALEALDRDPDGYDYFNVTTGGAKRIDSAVFIVPPMGTETSLIAPYAAAVKERVGKPVLGTGRINHPPAAEEALAKGQLDMCGMTRALICDPAMPNKALEDRIEDVRICIGCDQACIGHMHLGYPISCIQHPETGRELDYGSRATASERRRVMVAGGGPGGMKAAAVSAERGHSVTLYESAKQLGGQALLAQLLPGRSEFGGIVTNLEREMELSGVKIALSTPVTPDLVEREGPDALIIATGAKVRMPAIEGAEEAHVVNAWQVLRDEANCGQRVVVADWRCDWIGLGIAEKLARDGCSVRLVSTGYMPGETIPRYVRDRWVGQLHKLGVEIVPYARLYGVDAETAYFEHMTSGEAIVLEGVDTLVAALGHLPDTTLEETLADAPCDIHLVGDCLSPRTAEEAVLDGLKVGNVI